jgi:hypothetical protein
VRARLSGRVVAVDVLHHYGAQLKAANWSAAEESGAGGLASGVFRLTADGKSWYAVLSVMTVPGSPQADVVLYLRRLSG